MRRYLALYYFFIRNSFSGQLMFRANFVMNLLMYVCWIALQIILIETIFTHTASLAGWKKEEVYILVAFAHLGERLFNLFFRENLITIPDLVTDGNLDGILTKPISTLFFVSLRHLHSLALINLYFPFALFMYVAHRTTLLVSRESLIGAGLLVMSGIAVSYAVLLALETLSFWFLRFSNVHELHAAVFRMARNPLEIYGSARGIFFTIIPIAFTSYLPALALMGKLSWAWIVYGIVFSMICVAGAIYFWNIALKRYCSASS